MLPKEVHASYSFPLFKFAVAVAGALLRRWTTTATAATTTTTRVCVLLLLLLVCFSLNWAWLRLKNESVSDFLTFWLFLTFCVSLFLGPLRTFEDLWGKDSPAWQWHHRYNQRVDTYNCSGRAIRPSGTIQGSKYQSIKTKCSKNSAQHSHWLCNYSRHSLKRDGLPLFCFVLFCYMHQVNGITTSAFSLQLSGIIH